MEKFVWRATVREGMKEEYIRRHNEIWPEMVAALKEAGICNYTIWMVGEIDGAGHAEEFSRSRQSL